MKATVASTLAAMRATAIPEGSSGRWRVERTIYATEQYGTSGRMVPAGTWTTLRVVTFETLRKGGETVMCDLPCELRKHLDFILRAHGRVLVTGLGLGCVVRGLLTQDRVTRVDVIERDRHVLRLVRDHMPQDDRLRIYPGAALSWLRRYRQETWDCAWHDIWTDPDKDEPDLAIAHQQLILLLRKRVRMQGAWNFPRHARRALRDFNRLEVV